MCSLLSNWLEDHLVANQIIVHPFVIAGIQLIINSPLECQWILIQDIRCTVHMVLVYDCLLEERKRMLIELYLVRRL